MGLGTELRLGTPTFSPTSCALPTGLQLATRPALVQTSGFLANYSSTEVPQDHSRFNQVPTDFHWLLLD